MQGEDSEAYRAIQHLVTSTYRVRSFEDLALVKANSNRCFNAMACLATCCGARTFTVPNGAVRCASDGSGNFEMYGPGVHFIFSKCYRQRQRRSFLTCCVVVVVVMVVVRWWWCERGP